MSRPSYGKRGVQKKRRDEAAHQQTLKKQGMANAFGNVNVAGETKPRRLAASEPKTS